TLLTETGLFWRQSMNFPEISLLYAVPPARHHCSPTNSPTYRSQETVQNILRPAQALCDKQEHILLSWIHGSSHRSSVDTGQMGFVSDGVPGWIGGQYHLTKKDR